MTMLELLERSLFLDVGKMMVPFELGDQGSPLRAERKKRERTKKRHDLRTDACKRIGDCQSRLPVGSGRRRHKSQTSQLGFSLWRHDARQIVGISEEPEDQIGDDRHPLLELNAVNHSERMTRYPPELLVISLFVEESADFHKFGTAREIP